MPGLDPVAINKQLRSLSTPTACARVFREIIAGFGFDTFACGELDLQNRDRSVFYIIDWPERWTQFYRESGLINRDPIVSELATRHSPFTWTELRASRKFSQVGREALGLAKGFGWSEGLVVPFPQGGSRFGLVSLAGVDVITPQVRDMLALISLSLHSHVRTLVAREGFALPPAGLTPREIECVGLIAKGLSDAGIAKSLGIAPSTAHEFAEKAKRKLNAKSRAELIAIASSLAIIAI